MPDFVDYIKRKLKTFSELDPIRGCVQKNI
jgi:hypothetical protein